MYRIDMIFRGNVAYCIYCKYRYVYTSHQVLVLEMRSCIKDLDIALYMYTVGQGMRQMFLEEFVASIVCTES